MYQLIICSNAQIIQIFKNKRHHNLFRLPTSEGAVFLHYCKKLRERCAFPKIKIVLLMLVYTNKISTIFIITRY